MKVRDDISGESPNLSLYFLSMLPDPYMLAKRNTYKWTAEYLDTREEEKIIFDSMVSIIIVMTCLTMTW